MGDLRLGLRLLLKSPGFTIVAVLALALGIGANTAIFSAVDAVLLRALPYADASRLVMVWEDASHIGFARNTPAPANYVDWKRQNTVFTDMAALRSRVASFTSDGPPEFVSGQGATANLFSVLGVKPLLGRTFTEEEDRRGEKVVVLGYGLWQRRFGGDPKLVGRTVRMNDENVTVVGILPRGFSTPGSREYEFWIPSYFTPRDLANRGSHYLNVVARLKPGVSVERAGAEMRAIARRLEREYPDNNRRIGAVVVPVQEQIVGDNRLALIVLLCAAGCVLLIACANIANLLLARAAGRQREMAVRSALGAGRARLVRQMVTESVLLSLLGGAAGLVLAYWSLDLLEHYVPAALVQSAALAIDGRVLLFTISLSVLTGVVFGLAPALHAGRLSLAEVLKQGGRGSVGTSRGFRDALVVAEVALALVLLVGAGLMVQTLMKLRGVDPGFRPGRLLTMITWLPIPKYAEPPKRLAFYEAVLERLRALPGVRQAAFSSSLPFTARGNTQGYLAYGRPADESFDTLFRVGTSEYLQTLGARLLEGRLFGPEDRARSTPVVVVNETFARSTWPGESAVGKRVQASNDDAPWQTVVGVIADIRERGFDLTMKPGIYVPVVQVPDAWAVPYQLVLRTAGDPLAVVPAVREAIWSVDRSQAIAQIRTMEEIIDLEVANRAQQMRLLGAFAGLALLLACVGLYGVLSYNVTQRTREIGLRVALGAGRGQVTRMVVGHGLRLAGLGLAVGLAAAWALTRLMTRLLYEVSPTDAGTYAAVSAVLAVVALAACVVPARRAARLQPLEALREE